MNKNIQSVQTKLKNLNLKLYRFRGGTIANFIHIGKTGGSAIKSSLENCLETDKFIIHLRGHTCTLRDIPKGDRFFFCLRDPISRFVSAFNYKQRQTERERWKHPKFDLETRALETFKTPDCLAASLSAPDPQTQEAAVEAMQSIEHVDTFLLDWFESEEYFQERLDDCLYIAFQATLSSDFERLKKILHLPRDLSIVKDPKLAKANPGSQSTEISKEGEANLRRWFEKDYQFFELSRQVAEEVARRSEAKYCA